MRYVTKTRIILKLLIQSERILSVNRGKLIIIIIKKHNKNKRSEIYNVFLKIKQQKNRLYHFVFVAF